MVMHVQENSDITTRLKLVRQWGGTASDAVLDPACKIFSTEAIDGMVCYRFESDCAVAFGDPLCAPEDMPALTKAFHAFCQEKGWRVIHILASDNFANWALGSVCFSLVEFGEELYLDPHNDPRKKTGEKAQLVRRKVRHALKEGVTVQEYLHYDKEMEEALEQVAQTWLENRKGPQIHISNIYLFADRYGKRWLYAQRNNEIVGIIVLNQLQARKGWHLNHLMITKDAPHGTPEMLVTSALELLVQENCHLVTFGNIPRKELGKIEGLSKIFTGMSRLTYQIARRLFRLDGHKSFWEKFLPESRPSYLLFSQPKISFGDLRSLMRALNVTWENTP